jgi:hypothetical protein
MPTLQTLRELLFPHPPKAELDWYAAPMTKQNARAWEAMVEQGMESSVAYDHMAQWAAMLEERIAKLDPQYQAYHWGRRP